MQRFLPHITLNTKLAVSLSLLQFSSVQSISHVQLFVTPWTAAHQASLSITNSWSLFNSCPGWWCLPTISFSVIPFTSCLQSFPASGTSLMSQLFASASQSIRSFSWSKSPSNEYSGLISFRIDWFELLAVQGTLCSLLQHHSSKASILLHSAFFIVQLFTSIHDYWKNLSFEYMETC